MLTYEGSPRSTQPTKENPNNLKKIPLFFNVVTLWLDTFFPEMFNKFDTLFIMRTVELLEKAIKSRLYLFIIGKSLTTETLFQVWKVITIGGG